MPISSDHFNNFLENLRPNSSLPVVLEGFHINLRIAHPYH